MTPREAIDQAKDVLIHSRDLNSILNRERYLRVAVMPDIVAVALFDEMPRDIPNLYVTFTIEEGHFGKRLVADFQGHKEFAS
jgi:hypothetical protein